MYDSDKKPLQLDEVTSLANDDTFIVGDTSDTAKVVKRISKANLITQLESELNTRGVTDGDKGDITVSSSGTVWTIDNDTITTAKIADDAVTFDKIENISQDHFLGRHSAGSGSVQMLSASQARTVLGLGTVATSNDYNDLDNLPDLSVFDEVEQYANLAGFPATGNSAKFYLAQDTGIMYRWSGSAYVEISASLALGETSSTAYRGDRGKIAYDHSQLTAGNPHNVTKSDVGLGNVDNTSDLNKPISTATQTALDSKITAFADPNADRIVFWDDSAGAFVALTASTGLTISGTNMTVRTSSATQTGIVELATDAETVTGTDTSRATTPANITARLAAPGTIGNTTPGIATFTRLNYTYGVGTVSAIGNIGASRTFDWATATHFTGDLDANTTLDFSNAVSGQKITLALAYSGALRTIAWTPTIKWAGGSAPTGPDAAGAVLLVTVAYLGTTYYGSFEIFS